MLNHAHRYSFGGQLDEEELQLEVAAAIKRKEKKGKMKSFLRNRRTSP